MGNNNETRSKTLRKPSTSRAHARHARVKELHEANKNNPHQTSRGKLTQHAERAEHVDKLNTIKKYDPKRAPYYAKKWGLE